MSLKLISNPPGEGEPFLLSHIAGVRKALAERRARAAKLAADGDTGNAALVDVIADPMHHFEQCSNVYEIKAGKGKRQVIHVGYTPDGLWKVVNDEGEAELIEKPVGAVKVEVE
jgi:hypothetical protein